MADQCSQPVTPLKSSQVLINKMSFPLFLLTLKDCETRLRKLNDQKDMRLKELQKRYRDTYNAVEWLRSNQDKFKHTIHEPVALVVSIIGGKVWKCI